MVQVAIDFLRLTILAQQVTQDSLTPHPQDLLRKTGVAGTETLSVATMSTFALCGVKLPHAGARMDGDRLLNDKAVRDELANVLPWECGQVYSKELTSGIKG